LIILPSPAVASWFDAGWKYRRPLAALWEAERGRGDELATAEFYANGLARPNGADIRVTTDDGRLVASHVLMSGPGDRFAIVFALVRDVQKYYIYFGNDNPPPPRPDLADVKYDCGLLLESKVLPGSAPVNNAQQLREAWEASPELIGRTILDSPMLGINPFGPQTRIVSKVSGSLVAPFDGQYALAMTVDARGLVLIDGKPLLFATSGPADARFRATVNLARGRHEFVLYHAALGGWGRFTVAWMRPGGRFFEGISRAYVGAPVRCTVGAMEELHGGLVADFSVQYAGECFFAEHYSHRYRFAARPSIPVDRLQLRWDFGDGQTSTAAEPEHVYLADGTYTVTLTAVIGANRNIQSNRLVVSRDWEHTDKPPADEPPKQSLIVQSYDAATMPAAWLTWSTWLFERAGNLDDMTITARLLAALAHHDDPTSALGAMQDAAAALDRAGRPEIAFALWANVPDQSDLQPGAAEQLAWRLLWERGEFGRAAGVLEPRASQADNDVKRLYGQALLLSGQAEAGRKILESLPPGGDPAHRAAVGGAQARTIEFYITEKDAAAAEQAWQRWQQLYPADFLDGYSVLLRTRILELKKCDLAAANLARAFASAVPNSAYAPQLLDRASKLLAATDPAGSQALHKLLQQRYPEDPLSQR